MRNATIKEERHLGGIPYTAKKCEMRLLIVSQWNNCIRTINFEEEGMLSCSFFPSGNRICSLLSGSETVKLKLTTLATKIHQNTQTICETPIYLLKESLNITM